MTQSAPASAHIREMGKATGLTMVRQMLAMGLAFLNSIVLARILGPEGKGIFSVALLLPSTAVALANLGVAPSTVYYVARGVFGTGRAIDNSIRIAAVLSLFAALGSIVVILLWSGPLLPGVPLGSLYVSLIYIPVALLGAYLLAIVQGLQDFTTFNKIAISTNIAGLVVTTLLIGVCRMGVNGALIGISGGHVACAAGCLLALRDRRTDRPRMDLRPDREYTRLVFPYGLRSHLSNVSAYINSHVDLFLVNLMLNPAEAGIYTLATGLAERLAIISSSASTVILPRISELESSEHVRRELTPVITRHVAVVTCALALGATALASLMVTLFYGQDFAPAAGALRSLLVSIVMLSISRVLSSDIAGRGHPGVNAWISVAQMILNIGLDLVMIPPYGIVGAGVATSIAATAGAIARLTYYVRTCHVRWQDLLLLNRDDLARVGRVTSTQTARLYERARRCVRSRTDSTGGAPRS